MKSRLAILGMLVTGMLFSTAGAGLAISGIQNNASVAQYATPVCTPTPSGETNPAQTPKPDSVNGDVCEEGGVLPAEATNPAAENNPSEESGGGGGALPAEESQTQPERQVAAAAQTSQLPFTGFAAIPVLLGGLALLAGGLVLRRRTNSET